MLATRVRVGALSGVALSVLFAVLFTAVGTFELFFPSLMPRYGQPTPIVMRVPYGARVVLLGRGQLFDVHFQHQRIVLPIGTVLDPAEEEHRAAVKYDGTRRPPTVSRVGGAFVLYLIGCLLLTRYSQSFGHSRLRLLRSQVGLLVLVLGITVVARLLLLLTTLPPFWIPVTAVAFWASIGFDRRTSLLVHLGAAFMVASLHHFDVMLLSVLATQGLIAALLFVNRKQPRQMLYAGAGAGLVAAVGYVALTALFESEGGVMADLRLGTHSELLACVGGGILAGLLANLLREPAERVLGHVSRSRLLDLTDIESPLLREMATEAPGSWEHSRAMANLAEAAAASIGADSLLTRVGAYYHDVGKTAQPRYFIENLTSGERSPHDDLPSEVSADAIHAHVVIGTKMLREARVPEPVVEFAYSHHGTSVVEYFWGKYRDHCEAQEVPEAERLREDHFRYPGMKPLSRETAIVMLVDSIEAASRTIDPPSHDSFEEMIRRVVFFHLAAGQLDDSSLTVVDLRVMMKRMAATLVNMYHGRIKYPWQRRRGSDRIGSGEARATPTPLGATPAPLGATPAPLDTTAGSLAATPTPTPLGATPAASDLPDVAEDAPERP